MHAQNMNPDIETWMTSHEDDKYTEENLVILTHFPREGRVTRIQPTLFSAN